MYDLSAYLRALADRKRLRIVQYVGQHDGVTVTELGAALRLSQPLISWHLRMLRRAGIIKTRRAGRQVLCSLNRRAMIRYQKGIDEMFGLAAVEEQETSKEPAVVEAVGNA